MHHLTTKELLYLEDMSKLFDSIAKNCEFAANIAADPQLKSHMQSVAKEHQQWISATTAIVNKGFLQ